MPTRSTAGDDSTQVSDRLETVVSVVRVAFLLAVVAFALLPVLGVLVGAGPAPTLTPDVTPYLAFVGVAIAGTVAQIGTAILDA